MWPPVCHSSVQEKTKLPASPSQLCLAQMAGEELGLRHLAVPERVHPKLAQDQRLVADEVLQAEQ